MSGSNGTGTIAGYTTTQRRAIAVATVRLRLLRRFGNPTSRELADCLVEAARADLPVADVCDLVDVLFEQERIPASTIGQALRLARYIVEGEQHGGAHGHG